MNNVYHADHQYESYVIGFNGDDETCFDIEVKGRTIPEIMTELLDLFYGFCDENDFGRPAIDYIDFEDGQMREDDLFGEVTWADDDIEEAFELCEIESTPEKIAAVKQRALRRNRLQDAQIDAGWAVIRACIDELYGEED